MKKLYLLALLCPLVLLGQRFGGAPFTSIGRANRFAPPADAAAFSPSDISGMTLWLKADAGVFSDAGSTPAIDNDLVQQWNDQSGNGNHVSQATSGNRPTYNTGSQNGLPTVDCNSSDSRFFTSSMTDVFNSGGGGIFTVCFVGRPGDFSGDVHRVLYQANGLMLFQSPQFKVQKLSGGFETIVSTGDPTGIYKYVTVTRSGTGAGNTKIYINGSQNDDAVDIPDFSTGAVNLLGASGTAWTGPFAEIIVYNSVVSAGNLASLHTYLASKWGL